MTAEEILKHLNESSTHLIDSYRTADASLERYMETRTPIDLFHAASALCEGLKTLDRNKNFWLAVAGLPSLPVEQQEEAFDLISNDAEFPTMQKRSSKPSTTSW